MLRGLAVLGAASLLPRVGSAATPWRTADNPFRLGVASGYPTDRSVVLWTRVAPDPLAPDGGMPPADVDVQWEIAADEQFTRGLRRGTTQAMVAFGNSARVEVHGLQPDRHYWYRFAAGGQRSPVGRTRTLPAVTAEPATLHIALACCQHYEHGHYAALAHLATAAPDLVLHVGDYIYEGAPSINRVRTHLGTTCRALQDYRLRYSQYQLDASLQAAHAAAPWLVMWDDHEVSNDYAGLVGNRVEDPAVFLARRTAAYQAYFEHLPLPPSLAPRGSQMPIHTRRRIGNLAAIHVLDQRQYRSPEACPQNGRLGGNRLDDSCVERTHHERTMLGAVQEQWLEQGLAAAPAYWTLLPQGTVFSHLDEQPGDGHLYWSDAWNGYPAARQRLLDSLQRTRTSNPVVLSGDMHAFLVGNVNAIPEQLDSPVVATEFLAASLSSDAREQSLLDGWRAGNPNLQLVEGRHRGYVSLRLSPEWLTADLIAVDDVKDPASPCRTLQTFMVEAGRPGAQVA